MIRVEPAPDVSVRPHGGAGKQQGTGDDLFAALLALISGVAAPMQTLTIAAPGEQPEPTAGDDADALPVTGASLAAALGAIDPKALDATGADAKPGEAKAGEPGKATALPPGLAPTGNARAETPAGEHSKALDHTAAGEHSAAAAQPAADTPVTPAQTPPPATTPAPGHRPEQLPDTAAAPAVAATSAAHAGGDVQNDAGPAPTAYVSELPTAITEALARLRPHGGGVRLSVRLDPPNVGTVTISLHLMNDHVRLVMHAPDGVGADALQQQKHLVEAALSAEGLALEEFRVDVGGGQTGTPADSSPQGQGERMRSPRGAEHAASFTSIDAPVRSQRAMSGVWL